MALNIRDPDLDVMALRCLVVEQCAVLYQQLVAEHVETPIRIVGQGIREITRHSVRVRRAEKTDECVHAGVFIHGGVGKRDCGR